MIGFNRLNDFAKLIAGYDILIMRLLRARIVRELTGQLHFKIRKALEVKGFTKTGYR
ncbi:hypothetical protein D3C80_2196540 [compost metagenome]